MQLCSQPSVARRYSAVHGVGGARPLLVVAPAGGQASSSSTVTSVDYSPFSSRARSRDSYLQRDPIPIVVVPIPASAAPVLPKEVPIIHSSAYLQQTLQEKANASSSSEDAADKGVLEKTGTQLMRTGTQVMKTSTQVLRRTPRPRAYASSDQDSPTGTLELALRRADQSLDELEANPHPVQQVVYSISRGPVGQATTTAVQTAAKLTVQATVQAAKVAAPFGRWALAEGAKAAAKLIQAAVVEGVKAQSRQATQAVKKGDKR